MILAQSARMDGHDPWVCLKDVLTRLLTPLACEIDALLLHRWAPTQRG